MQELQGRSLENSHLLVLPRARPLINLANFSYRHGLNDDAKAIPHRIYPLDKLQLEWFLSRNPPHTSRSQQIQQKLLLEIWYKGRSRDTHQRSRCSHTCKVALWKVNYMKVIQQGGLSLWTSLERSPPCHIPI